MKLQGCEATGIEVGARLSTLNVLEIIDVRDNRMDLRNNPDYTVQDMDIGYFMYITLGVAVKEVLFSNNPLGLQFTQVQSLTVSLLFSLIKPLLYNILSSLAYNLFCYNLFASLMTSFILYLFDHFITSSLLL